MIDSQTIDHIAATVANYYGVTTADIYGIDRHVTYVAARFTMYGVLQDMGLGVSEISTIFRRYHTTVLNGLHKANRAKRVYIRLCADDCSGCVFCVGELAKTSLRVLDKPLKACLGCGRSVQSVERLNVGKCPACYKRDQRRGAKAAKAFKLKPAPVDVVDDGWGLEGRSVYWAGYPAKVVKELGKMVKVESFGDVYLVARSELR